MTFKLHVCHSVLLQKKQGCMLHVDRQCMQGSAMLVQLLVGSILSAYSSRLVRLLKLCIWWSIISTSTFMCSTLCCVFQLQLRITPLTYWSAQQGRPPPGGGSGTAQVSGVRSGGQDPFRKRAITRGGPVDLLRGSWGAPQGFIWGVPGWFLSVLHDYSISNTFSTVHMYVPGTSAVYWWRYSSYYPIKPVHMLCTYIAKMQVMYHSKQIRTR